jgi:hypothetical protein
MRTLFPLSPPFVSSHPAWKMATRPCFPPAEQQRKCLRMQYLSHKGAKSAGRGNTISLEYGHTTLFTACHNQLERWVCRTKFFGLALYAAPSHLDYLSYPYPQRAVAWPLPGGGASNRWPTGGGRSAPQIPPSPGGIRSP